MKLYTENQVRNALKDAMLRGMRKPSKYEYIVESMMDDLTHIELPSDEEIEKLSRYKPTENVPYNPLLNLVWIEGAKSMRDKIQQRNSEQ